MEIDFPQLHLLEMCRTLKLDCCNQYNRESSSNLCGFRGILKHEIVYRFGLNEIFAIKQQAQ